MNKPTAKYSSLHIKKLRHALLNLHKTLLDYQKLEYEKRFGKIRNSQDLYILAANDPHFLWLRSISELIVSIDAITEQANAISTTKAKALFSYIKSLLNPAERKRRFEKEYYKAMQKDPAIIIAHSRVKKTLNG